MTAPGGRGNMATKKKTTGASQPEVKGLSDTKRWIYGFALLFFALFVGVAVVSYFIYWRDDQNVALWSRVLAAGEQGQKIGDLIHCMEEVIMKIMMMIIKFTPIGVFCLRASSR